MDKVKKFLEECRNNPKADELFKGGKPKSEAEMFSQWAGLAKDMGYDVTADDLSAYYEKALKERAERTAAVTEKIIVESDAVLTAVAGGEGGSLGKDDCGGMFDVCKAGFMLMERESVE